MSQESSYFAMAHIRFAFVAALVGVAAADSYNCPGSGSWVHASMKVTTTAATSCAMVRSEILARAGAEGGWKDPHNRGIYTVLASNGNVVKTQRTTNPATSVGGRVYTDKQNFVLTDVGGSCQIMACSESQGTSVGDFSTNYCDIRNLYCGSADGCTPVHSDFTSVENEHSGSVGAGHDFSKCIVKTAEVAAAAPEKHQNTYESYVNQGYQCPGSSALLFHARMKVTATAAISCDKVMAEMQARASPTSGWKDPHFGGIYSVLSSSGGVLQTQRLTNPKKSVGGKVYRDKQTFVLTDQSGSCQIKACSESQGTSFADFSTNYCNIRNLYCGSKDGCKPVSNDFNSTEDSHSGSIGAGHGSVICLGKYPPHEKSMFIV